MSFSAWVKNTGAARAFVFVLGAALVLGCGKDKDKDGSKGEPGKSGPGEQPGEPKAEATVTADVLYKDRDKYDGKWVIVIARIPRISEQKHADGHTEASIDLQGEDGKVDSLGLFESDEWAKTPKFEDGVRYEILGQFDKGGNFGGRLKKCHVVGKSKSERPAPAATLTAEELLKDAAKYKDKLIQVKGVVGTGIPAQGPSGGSVTLTGENNRFITCLLAAGQFDKVLPAGLGATVELTGTVADAGAFVTMTDCAIVQATAAGSPVGAEAFAKEFTQNAADAEKKYKDKFVTIRGKVQSVADGKLVLTASAKGGSKSGITVTAGFSPDWKTALAKLKAGDNVAVSGQFGFFSQMPDNISLDSCWLVPK